MTRAQSAKNLKNPEILISRRVYSKCKKEIETQIKSCEYDALKYSYFVRMMMQYGDVFCKCLCCLFSGEDELVEASQCFS